jgi:hypothetical protein
MAKRSRTSSSIPSSKLFSTGNSSVDSAWREALAIRDLGTNTRGKSQKRLAQAQVVRAQAESEAITATKNYCVDARAEADDKLQRAELALSKAERIRSDAQEWIASTEVEIKFRLDEATRKRASARTYAEQLETTARSASDSLMDQTRSGAEELASRMRTETAEDIRKILAEIEMARAAAEDELEAQRLLTETARVRAFTVGLNVEDSRTDQVQTRSAPKAKKPVKRATSAKKRTTKAKAKAAKPTPIGIVKPRSARKAA